MNAVKLLSGRFRRGALAVLHHRNIRREAYCLEPPILITGSPRSGTTWLTEIVASQSRGVMVDEPLYLSKPHVQAAGFSWRTCIQPGERRIPAERLFEGIFSGSAISPREILGNTIVHVLRSRRLVVKSVRAMRLLGWLSEVFPSVRVVVLARHPCAVVSSQMRHEHFPSISEVADFDREYVAALLPHLLSWVDSLSSEVEYRALTWALDQHAYLTLEGDSPQWSRLFYENLVEEGWPAVKRGVSHVGITLKDPSSDLMRRNSREAKGFSADHSSASVNRRLVIWQDRLSSRQVERILSVVKQVGISGYGRGVYPGDAGLMVEPGSSSGRKADSRAAGEAKKKI